MVNGLAIGWVITGIEVLYRAVTNMFKVWGDESKSLGEKIIRSMFAIPTAILQTLWSPFEMLLDLVGGLFGFDGIGSAITNGISSTVDAVFNILDSSFGKLVGNISAMFEFAWEKLKNFFLD